MGTRADHEITPMLSVRYCLHGGVAYDTGPFQLTMSFTHAPEGSSETASAMMCSELTRDQAGELLKCLQHAIELWDERVKGGDDGRA